LEGRDKEFFKILMGKPKKRWENVIRKWAMSVRYIQFTRDRVEGGEPSGSAIVDAYFTLYFAVFLPPIL
jgi:hypothetical protein